MSKIGTLAKATNINSQQEDFVADIRQMIRKAWVVVAVCSPEAETKSPNPNVMYELGYAASIGKVTVILTSDINTLPSDIDKQYAFKYNPKQVMKRDFSNELIIAIEKAKDRASNHSTDSLRSDVRLAQAQDWMYTDPELWRDYVEVMHFAKAVHTVFQNLISPLNSFINLISDNINLIYAKTETKAWAEKAKCDKSFLDYCLYQKRQFQEKIGET